MAANDRQEGGAHYKGAPVEHWDFVLMHNIPYMEAQVIKYVMRWRAKNGLEDLRKARHFIEKLIEWEVSENMAEPGTTQATLEQTRAFIDGRGDNNYMNPDSGVPRGKGYVDQD